MKSLANFSVKNSLIVNVISVFIVVAGIVSIFQMNREAFPNVEMDVVTIQTVYPNSTPTEVEKLITIPIEKELKEVDDIDEMSSISAEGISRIIIKLDEDLENKIQVLNDIQRAVDRAEGLPTDLPDKPHVTELKTKNTPIIEVSLSGDLPEDTLRKLAKGLEKKLEKLPGLSKVSKAGYREKEIWVEVTPGSLKQNHISFKEIIDALKNQNKTIPGGKVYTNNKEFILRTSGEFDDSGDVQKTVIRASSIGSWLTVQDVADVTEGFEEETVINKTNGTRSINLNIIKKEKGDTISLVNQIQDMVDEFKETAPKELNVSYANDTSFFIKRRLNVLINNGVIGLTLVTISLFIFLSLGTAIGACLGIPTALLMSFALMNISGLSINLISMFGLIMVLGMIVDEDIVISENIFRHIEKGDDPQTAAIQGTNEINKAVITTVLTTVAAFIPLFFMGGIMGKFTLNIPIVVILALIASLTEALFILPSHVSDISHFIRSKFKPRNKVKAKAFFDKATGTYKNILTHTIKRRYLYVFLLFSIFLGSLGIVMSGLVGFQLFPSGGVEMFFIRAEVKEGSSLQQTELKFKEVEKLIEKLPKNELDNYVTQVGIKQREANDPQSSRASNIGQIIVYLHPEADRDRKADEIMDDLREKIKNLKGFEKLNLNEVAHGPPVGSPVAIEISGDDFKILNTIAEKYKKALGEIPGVFDIDDNYDDSKVEKHITVDAEKAAQLGLTLDRVAQTIRHAFEGAMATKIVTPEEEIEIVVKYPNEYRHQNDALMKLLVANQKGNLIPLSKVAAVSDKESVHGINHLDGTRSIIVDANIDEKVTTSVAVNQVLAEKYSHIANEYKGYHVNLGGEMEDTQESMHNLFTAFYLSAFLIAIILIAMFKSLTQPLVIMVSIPFSIIGVIIAFFLHGEKLSFMAILGLIGLTGIVVNGAIIMIDFINRFHKSGHPMHEAIIHGSSVRFRPVILTGITTVLGVLPAAYGIGGRDPFIVPMAMALNYGLIFSTFLTLIYVPIFLAIVHDVETKLKRIFVRS